MKVWSCWCPFFVLVLRLSFFRVSLLCLGGVAGDESEPCGAAFLFAESQTGEDAGLLRLVAPEASAPGGLALWPWAALAQDGTQEHAAERSGPPGRPQSQRWRFWAMTPFLGAHLVPRPKSRGWCQALACRGHSGSRAECAG